MADASEPEPELASELTLQEAWTAATGASTPGSPTRPCCVRGAAERHHAGGLVQMGSPGLR